MSSCVIIGGADISDYEWVLESVEDECFVIYCDSGLKHMKNLGLEPDLIVGDFDSYKGSIPKGVKTITLPVKKDDTDTVYAIKEGIRLGYKSFILLGVTGGRLDHTLVNVSALAYLYSRNLKGIITDDYSVMEIVPFEGAVVEKSYEYFSLICLSEKARGVVIENALFPLEGGDIDFEYQYGISNKVKEGCDFARVFVREGRLLLIKVRRDVN